MPIPVSDEYVIWNSRTEIRNVELSIKGLSPSQTRQTSVGPEQIDGTITLDWSLRRTFMIIKPKDITGPPIKGGKVGEKASEIVSEVAIQGNFESDELITGEPGEDTSPLGAVAVLLHALVEKYTKVGYIRREEVLMRGQNERVTWNPTPERLKDTIF